MPGVPDAVATTANRGDSRPFRTRLWRAAVLAGALVLILASRVYVTFNAHRVKLVQSTIAPVDGQIAAAPNTAELARLTAPFAVIARIRHDSASRERFAIAIDGRVVCESRVRAGASRRLDCAVPGGWHASSIDHVVVTGTPSSWSLDYLELATHHGATRGYDLVIIPAISTQFAPIPRAWVGLTVIGLIGLFLIEPSRMPRPLQVAYGVVAAGVTTFLALVLISRVVSPYTVLLSRTAYVEAVALLLAPRLWTAGQRLIPRPEDHETPVSYVRASARQMVLVTGTLGFALGAFVYPDWQVAVETAQVLAGLVTYPSGNPFYVYHTKLWTALHQVCAALLSVGVSERTLSVMVSGAIGAVGFQAVSALVYALSRDFVLAVGAPFIVLFTGIAEYGVIYPITLVGTTHTYGALGLSSIVLVAALFGMGCVKPAAFLLGIMPAVHPSLGVWFVVVVGLATLWDNHARERLKSVLPFFLAGCGLTICSYGVHVWLTQDVPPISRAMAGIYLAAFVRFWDGHRAQVDFSSLGIAMNVGALGLAAIWLYVFGGDLPRPARFLLRIIAVSGAVSLVLALFTRAHIGQVPDALLILMPGRFLNFNAFVFPSLLIGLIGHYRTTSWRNWLTLAVVAVLLFTERSRLWTVLGANASMLQRIMPTRPVDTLAVVGLASMTLLMCVRMSSRNGGQGRGASLARVSTLAVMCWVAIQTWALSARPLDVLRDRTNDALFAAAAAEKGLLLTGGDLHLVQLRTRRTVLVDGGGLDGLPYALEAGPELDRILRDVYAIDLFDPPEEARGTGTIPHAANRSIWERYPPAKWRDIRRMYEVTQVLTYADWQLTLPVVARNEKLVLYEIPP